MAPITIVGKWTAKDEEALSKLTDILKGLAEESVKWPEVTTFLVLKPDGESGSGGVMPDTMGPLDVVVIEGYDDPADRAKLGKEPSAVKAISKLFSLSTNFTKTELHTELSFSRSKEQIIQATSTSANDTFIVLARFGYQPGTTKQYALTGWKALLNHMESHEKETLYYGCYTGQQGDTPFLTDEQKEELAKKAETEETLYTVEVYANKQFVYDVHVKSEALKENGRQNGMYRTGKNEADKLRVVAGYLTK